MDWHSPGYHHTFIKIYTVSFLMSKCMAIWTLFIKLILAFWEDSKIKLQMCKEMVKTYDWNANIQVINCPTVKGDQRVFIRFRVKAKQYHTSSVVANPSQEALSQRAYQNYLVIITMGLDRKLCASTPLGVSLPPFNPTL